MHEGVATAVVADEQVVSVSEVPALKSRELSMYRKNWITWNVPMEY